MNYIKIIALTEKEETFLSIFIYLQIVIYRYFYLFIPITYFKFEILDIPTFDIFTPAIKKTISKMLSH